MSKSIVRIVKRYLFPPLHRTLVLALLAFAGTALVIGLGADTQLHTEGVVFGVRFAISYENKASLWAGCLLFIALVGLAIWLFFKVNSPLLPRYKQIAELEDVYQQRGNQDSVCTFFREVYGVYVSPAELDDLMQKKEVSFRARCLKKARPHIEFLPSSGFRLKSPKFPYRFSMVLFTGVYFVAALLCMASVVLATVAVAAASYLFAAKLFVCLFSFGVLAWVSLAAYSACNSALLLIEPPHTG